jgi:N-acyl-D-aspartate/D-glutamate deacylase
MRINIAAFVGHSSIRTWVMGEDAPRRAASGAEVAQMRAIVADAMRSGAVGFSTTTSPAHNGEGGLPMPSRLADDSELATLAGSLKDAGRGVFMLTKGAHTRIAFLEELAAANARPVVIAALLHNPTNPQVVFDDLDAIDAANARGRKLVGACPAAPHLRLHHAIALSAGRHAVVEAGARLKGAFSR